MIAEGHWAISFLETAADEEAEDTTAPTDDKTSTAQGSGTATVAKLPFVVDPTVVFGMGTSLVFPANFETTAVEDLVRNKSRQRKKEGVRLTLVSRAFAADSK